MATREHHMIFLRPGNIASRKAQVEETETLMEVQAVYSQYRIDDQ